MGYCRTRLTDHKDKRLKYATDMGSSESCDIHFSGLGKLPRKRHKRQATRSRALLVGLMNWAHHPSRNRNYGFGSYWSQSNRERRSKMKLSYRGLFILFCIVFVFGLAGCQQEGTAEKAGQKIDQAAESAGKKVEKAGEAVVEKVEKTGEYMDDSAITAKITQEK